MTKKSVQFKVKNINKTLNGNRFYIVFLIRMGIRTVVTNITQGIHLKEAEMNTPPTNPREADTFEVKKVPCKPGSHEPGNIPKL